MKSFARAESVELETQLNYRTQFPNSNRPGSSLSPCESKQLMSDATVSHTNKIEMARRHMIAIPNKLRILT